MRLPKIGLLYAPLAFIIGYLIVVQLITLFGPVIYVDYDWVRVSIFLGAVCVAIAIGFSIGVRRKMVLADPAKPVPLRPYSQRIFRIMLIISFLGLAYTVGAFLTSGNVNLSFSAIGQAYNDGYKDYERNSGTYSLAFILYSLQAAPLFIVTIWGLFYFKTLTPLFKTMVLMTVFVTPVVFMLSAGQQKTIGDLVIYLSAIFALKAATRGKLISARALTIIIIVGLVGAFAFINILSQRYADIGINAGNINRNEIALIRYNTNHIVFKIFGDDLGFTISILCMYIGNGLAGLGYCLDTPFTWSHMMGFAYPLSVIADRFLGLPFPYYDTYPFVAGKLWGWGEAHWFSIFPWFASDFTFYGTVPLFGYFAYVYGRCWVECIRFANPYAIMMFCMLTLGVVMAPCNNQLMQTPGGLLTVFVTVCLYLAYRRQYNRPAPVFRPAPARYPATPARERLQVA